MLALEHNVLVNLVADEINAGLPSDLRDLEHQFTREYRA